MSAAQKLLGEQDEKSLQEKNSILQVVSLQFL